MKRIILLSLALAFAGGVFGQASKIDSKTPVEFCGVDYSKAKVIGVQESPSDLKRVFGSINYLFVSESKKFDVEKFFNKSEVTVNIDVVKNNNEEINESGLITNNSSYVLSDSDVSSLISNYKFEKTEGVALVVIAEKLDKGKSVTSFDVVYFDKATKKILLSKKVTGKAGGFGLRNYWAASVYAMMKDWKE